MANAHKLLEDALELSEEDREQLAWTLLDSLHDAHEERGAAGAWGEEIRRRLADYRTNPSEGRPWQEVDAAMRARLVGK